MTPWGADETFYDDVERDHLPLLKSKLPQYLAHHEVYRGFLPDNFNGGTLGPDDPRAVELRRMGFLNYSILINLLVVQRAADSSPALTSMLDVYERTSAFFLRVGAALDLSVALEKCQGRLYASGTVVDGQGDTPKAATLQKKLEEANRYNNFLKHNGLPAVRLIDDGNGGKVVQIPNEIPTRAALWSAQKPNAPLGTLLGSTALDVMAAFDRYYGALAAQSIDVLRDWQLAATVSPAGIRTVLKQSLSGALPSALDGYQSSAATSYFLKWG